MICGWSTSDRWSTAYIWRLLPSLEPRQQQEQDDDDDDDETEEIVAAEEDED